MICTQCHHPFEGAGMYCPRCTSIAVNQRSAQRNAFLAQTPEIEIASKFDRVLAYLVDAIPSSVFQFIGLLVAGQILNASEVVAFVDMSEAIGRNVRFTPTNLQMIILSKMTLATLLPYLILDFLYHALLECSVAQGTFGKILFGLRVATPDGHRISLGRALARYLARFVLAIPFAIVAWVLTMQNFLVPNVETAIYIAAFILVISVIGTMWLIYAPIFFTSRAQGVHDLVAGTIVTIPYPVSSGR
ncbi:MAG: RDD family protein, partial [Deltaproteobacteria bacterium]|nr:RDD family protein [Deltaproteobacteria bacterium]